MKKLSGLALIALLLSSTAWAQRGRGGGVRGGVAAHGGFRGGSTHGVRGFGGLTPRRAGSGFGNVVFPGGDYAGMRMRGISPGVWFPWYSYWPAFSTFGAYSPYYFSTPFFGGTPLGSYVSYPYGTPAQQPDVIVISGNPGGYAQPAATPLVVNQITPQPAAPPPAVIRAYPPQAPPEPIAQAPETGYGSRLYLIALRSGLIHAALAYWVEDGKLHYITRDRRHREVALTAVDLKFSTQLNRERRVPFQLPPA